MSHHVHSAAERRRSERHRHAHEHRIVSAVVRPGHRVRIIDISADGVLLEIRHRLMPGMKVDLQVTTPTRHASLRGHVVRCTVARVRSTSMCYRGAIRFDRHVPWLAEDDRGGRQVA